MISTLLTNSHWLGAEKKSTTFLTKQKQENSRDKKTKKKTHTQKAVVSMQKFF
jgi:hypothetical protein